MDRERYLEYVAHFNNKRYDAVTSYFTPDITVEYYDNASYSGPPAKTLYGPQGFIENYKRLHEYVDEVLELGDFMVNERLLFAELWTEFYCFKEPEEGSGLPWKKGDLVLMTNWVLYDLVGDKMKRIRIAHFRMHDPKLTKFFKDKL
jgi:hypothetical protein